MSETSIKAAPIAKEPYIRSGSVSAAANAETSLHKRILRNGMTPKLEDFAFVGDSGATGNVTLRFYVNGVRYLSGDMTEIPSRYAGGGDEPIPVEPAMELPPGAEIEWRAYNSHASDAFAVEVKAVIRYYP